MILHYSSFIVRDAILEPGTSASEIWCSCDVVMVMWWLIGRYCSVAHWRRCGGSLEDQWWLIRRYVVAHWKICGGSF